MADACILPNETGLCPMGNVLYPGFHTTNNEKGPRAVFYNSQACNQCTCKCTKDARGRFRYIISMAKEDFSKNYNDKSLTVRRMRIKPDKEIMKQRKSIVEHPFGTIKRAYGCRILSDQRVTKCKWRIFTYFSCLQFKTGY